jgi:hypothetical protein
MCHIMYTVVMLQGLLAIGWELQGVRCATDAVHGLSSVF